MVLQQDGEEALQGAENGPVEHDGRALCAVLVDVIRAQPAGHVQVHLQRAALPVAADGIPQHELELRAVEGALARVQACTRCRRRAAAALRACLGAIPDFIRAHPLGRPVGELDAHIVEAEIPIDIQDAAW